jgi:two-component system response regulator AtoC
MTTTVLVVVESIDLRRLLAASIANDGHEVTTAATAAEALSILRASPTPVVAYFDYRLPDGTLIDLLPTIEKDGPALQRHRYVTLLPNPLDIATRPLADRLGVATLVVPCSLGDLTWHITRKARELGDG